MVGGGIRLIGGKMSKKQERLDKVEAGIKDLQRQLSTQRECIELKHDLAFDSAYYYDLSGTDVNRQTGIISKCSRCGYVKIAEATDREKKAIEALNIHVGWGV